MCFVQITCFHGIGLLYSRFGWKWAALAHMAGRILQHDKQVPSDIAGDLALTKTKMESGCYGVCDVAADLRSLETRLFTVLLELDESEVHNMLELIGKAMSGTLQEKDIDLRGFKPLLADCSIPTVCQG